jgi:hypothetical protein
MVRTWVIPDQSCEGPTSSRSIALGLKSHTFGGANLAVKPAETINYLSADFGNIA